jgi:hypothetical protein
MKPQIITDLSASEELRQNRQAQLIKGASWKKQRIIVILPADAMIPAKVALSHWNLVFPPNNGVVRILAQGMEVGEAYSNTVDMILNHSELNKWEYILTIEHDNMPPQDGVLRLVERLENNKHLAAVSGLYFTKGYGGVAQIWGDATDPIINFRPQVPKPGELIECCGLGMGFSLMRIRMFKDSTLRKPWFKTIAGKDGAATQDLYFWNDARQKGYRCAVDCSVLVGHYDAENDIVW